MKKINHKIRIVTTLFFTLFLSQFGFSQSTDKSKTLLDEVSNKIATHKNILIGFEYNLDNDKEKVHQKTIGTVKIQGQKYHLDFMGVEKIFDLKKVYTIMHEDEEIVISNPTVEENEFSPSSILSFYKKGYHYTWDKVAMIEGKKIQFIKLTPIKAGEVTYIMLGIDTQNKQIEQVEYLNKKNTKTTLKIKSFKPNTEMSPKEFLFDEVKFKTKNYSMTRM